MIFKKHITVMLAFFLLVSNLGLAFNVHYCDDEIASITINRAPSLPEVVDECCGIVETNSECCNDKLIKADLKSDQIIVKAISFNACFFDVTNCWQPQIVASNDNFNQKGTVTYYCDAHAPPFYLLYSQYTFYC